MYLQDLLASLRRRWYLFLVAILVTAAACYGVAKAVGPTYAAEGAVVLLPPPDPKNPDTNRFLSLGSLKEAGDVLIRSLRSDRTHRTIVRAAPGGDYTVDPDFTTSAPVIVIRSEAPSAGAAAAILRAVLEQLPRSLADLQSALGIAAGNRIVSEAIQVDGQPEFVPQGQLRAAAGAGVLLLALLSVLIGAVDGLIARRRSHRSEIRAVPSPEDTTTPDSPTPLVGADRAGRTGWRPRR
jgi:hypothetical protein